MKANIFQNEPIMPAIFTHYIFRLTICCFALLTVMPSCKSASATDSKADELAALTDSIEKIAAECPGEIGVALIVNNKDTVVVNNSNVYPMMSVFKVHQALAVCEDFDHKGISLDTVLSVNRSDLDPETWSPMLKEHTEVMISLPVSELLRYTLTQSDNNASNLMFERLIGVTHTDSLIATVIPRTSFNIAYSEGEMSLDHDKAYSNSTSPLGAAVLMNRLYTDSLVSPDKQAFITATLRECKTGTDRIVAPLLGKEGVTVGHKTGSGYTKDGGILVAHNDVAYVTLPCGTCYTLAVFVKDIPGSETLAASYVARISAAVYNALSR